MSSAAVFPYSVLTVPAAEQKCGEVERRVHNRNSIVIALLGAYDATTSVCISVPFVTMSIFPVCVSAGKHV